MGASFQSAGILALATATVACPAAAQVATPAVVITEPLSPDSRLTLTGPLSWSEPPVPEFPERAESRGIASGFVTIQCGFGGEGALRDCEIIAEEPAGAGFGQSVLSAAGSARLSPTTVASAPIGSVTRFSMNFRWPFPPPPVGYIGRPEDLAFAGAAKATVGVKCAALTNDAAFTNCEVTEESAPGLGFDHLALNAAARARVSPAVADRSDEVASVTFSLTFP